MNSISIIKLLRNVKETAQTDISIMQHKINASNVSKMNNSILIMDNVKKYVKYIKISIHKIDPVRLRHVKKENSSIIILEIVLHVKKATNLIRLANYVKQFVYLSNCIIIPNINVKINAMSSNIMISKPIFVLIVQKVMHIMTKIKLVPRYALETKHSIKLMILVSVLMAIISKITHACQ